MYKKFKAIKNNSLKKLSLLSAVALVASCAIIANSKDLRSDSTTSTFALMNSVSYDDFTWNTDLDSDDSTDLDSDDDDSVIWDRGYNQFGLRNAFKRGKYKGLFNGYSDSTRFFNNGYFNKKVKNSEAIQTDMKHIAHILNTNLGLENIISSIIAYDGDRVSGRDFVRKVADGICKWQEFDNLAIGIKALSSGRYDKNVVLSKTLNLLKMLDNRVRAVLSSTELFDYLHTYSDENKAAAAAREVTNAKLDPVFRALDLNKLIGSDETEKKNMRTLRETALKAFDSGSAFDYADRSDSLSKGKAGRGIADLDFVYKVLLNTHAALCRSYMQIMCVEIMREFINIFGFVAKNSAKFVDSKLHSLKFFKEIDDNSGGYKVFKDYGFGKKYFSAIALSSLYEPLFVDDYREHVIERYERDNSLFNGLLDTNHLREGILKNLRTWSLAQFFGGKDIGLKMDSLKKVVSKVLFTLGGENLEFSPYSKITEQFKKYSHVLLTKDSKGLYLNELILSLLQCYAIDNAGKVQDVIYKFGEINAMLRMTSKKIQKLNSENYIGIVDTNSLRKGDSKNNSSSEDEFSDINKFDLSDSVDYRQKYSRYNWRLFANRGYDRRALYRNGFKRSNDEENKNVRFALPGGSVDLNVLLKEALGDGLGTRYLTILKKLRTQVYENWFALLKVVNEQIIEGLTSSNEAAHEAAEAYNEAKFHVENEGVNQNNAAGWNDQWPNYLVNTNGLSNAGFNYYGKPGTREVLFNGFLEIMGMSICLDFTRTYTSYRAAYDQAGVQGESEFKEDFENFMKNTYRKLPEYNDGITTFHLRGNYYGAGDLRPQLFGTSLLMVPTFATAFSGGITTDGQRDAYSHFFNEYGYTTWSFLNFLRGMNATTIPQLTNDLNSNDMLLLNDFRTHSGLSSVKKAPIGRNGDVLWNEFSDDKLKNIHGYLPYSQKSIDAFMNAPNGLTLYVYQQGILELSKNCYIDVDADKIDNLNSSLDNVYTAEKVESAVAKRMSELEEIDRKSADLRKKAVDAIKKAKLEHKSDNKKFGASWKGLTCVGVFNGVDEPIGNLESVDINNDSNDFYIITCDFGDTKNNDEYTVHLCYGEREANGQFKTGSELYENKDNPVRFRCANGKLCLLLKKSAFKPNVSGIHLYKHIKDPGKQGSFVDVFDRKIKVYLNDVAVNNKDVRSNTEETNANNDGNVTNLKVNVVNDNTGVLSSKEGDCVIERVDKTNEYIIQGKITDSSYYGKAVTVAFLEDGVPINAKVADHVYQQTYVDNNGVFNYKVRSKSSGKKLGLHLYKDNINQKGLFLGKIETNSEVIAKNENDNRRYEVNKNLFLKKSLKNNGKDILGDNVSNVDLSLKAYLPSGIYGCDKVTVELYDNETDDFLGSSDAVVSIIKYNTRRYYNRFFDNNGDLYKIDFSCDSIKKDRDVYIVLKFEDSDSYKDSVRSTFVSARVNYKDLKNLKEPTLVSFKYN